MGRQSTVLGHVYTPVEHDATCLVVVLDSQGDLYCTPQPYKFDRGELYTSTIRTEYPGVIAVDAEGRSVYDQDKVLTYLETACNEEERQDGLDDAGPTEAGTFKTLYTKTVVKMVVRATLAKYKSVVSDARPGDDQRCIVMVFDYMGHSVFPKKQTHALRREQTSAAGRAQRLYAKEMWKHLMDWTTLSEIMEGELRQLGLSTDNVVVAGHRVDRHGSTVPHLMYNRARCSDLAASVTSSIGKFHGLYLEGEDGVMCICLDMATHHPSYSVVAYSMDTDLKYSAAVMGHGTDNFYVLAPSTWVETGTPQKGPHRAVKRHFEHGGRPSLAHRHNLFTRVCVEDDYFQQRNLFRTQTAFTQKCMQLDGLECKLSTFGSVAFVEGVFLGGDFNVGGVYRFGVSRVLQYFHRPTCTLDKLPVVVMHDDPGDDYRRIGKCVLPGHSRTYGIHVHNRVLTRPASYVKDVLRDVTTQKKGRQRDDVDKIVRNFRQRRERDPGSVFASPRDGCDELDTACCNYIAGSIFMLLKIMWAGSLEPSLVTKYKNLVTDHGNCVAFFESLFAHASR